jgi:MerR family transcriptional regulator, light-induced transcriptional regulator
MVLDVEMPSKVRTEDLSTTNTGRVFAAFVRYAPLWTTRVDSGYRVGYPARAEPIAACTSPGSFRALNDSGRFARHATFDKRNPRFAMTRRHRTSHSAGRPLMTRSTLNALTQDCLTQSDPQSETHLREQTRDHAPDYAREHTLPFNSDSPEWTRVGRSRAEAELRMTQLVKTLESEVIPRLLEAHRVAPTGLLPAVSLCPPPTAAEVAAFAKLVLGHDDVPVNECISDIRRKGMSVEMVYLDLLAPVAKYLGDLWMDDRCDFTEVTVGLGRLQHLLQELSPAFGGEVQFPANARRTLLMPAPGDQHTFGLAMVAEFFGRSGWEVASGNISSPTNAVDMARSEWFDVIGFSVGSETRLDWLRDCIATVRQVSRNKNVGIMVGGPVFLENPEHVAQVGADCTAADAKDAPIQAEILIGKRVLTR